MLEIITLSFINKNCHQLTRKLCKNNNAILENIICFIEFKVNYKTTTKIYIIRSYF